MPDVYVSQVVQDEEIGAHGPVLLMQTFTPSSTFRIEKLRLYVGNSSETQITCNFYATSGGYITGNPLTTEIKFWANDDSWNEIIVFPKIVFEVGVTYAIIIKAPDAAIDFTVGVSAEGGLSGGSFSIYDNFTWPPDGSYSWLETDYDLTFQLTGIAPEPFAPYGPTPVDGLTSIPVGIKLEWLNGSYASSVDVYLNKTSYNADPVTKVVDDENVDSYQPPTELELGEEYVWKIVARNEFGTTESGTYTFTTGTPIEITNVAELQAMNDNKSATYILMNDIDASATSGWNGGAGFLPIGDIDTDFTGILYGNGFTIDGLTVNRPTTQYIGGLFGMTIGYADDVHLTNVSINGRQYIGGFAGFMYGNCRRCSVEGNLIQTGTSYRNVGGFVGYASDVTIEDCISDVNITSPSNATGYTTGGFVGFNSGVSAIRRCYSSGNVVITGTGGAGGFVGSNSAFITDCYSTGNVSVSAVSGVGGGFCAINNLTGSLINCYSIGALTGKNLGGFCQSKNSSSVITSCYYDSTVSGCSDTGKGIPETTTDMKKEATFVNWDFTSPVWYIIEDESYPEFEAYPPEKVINPTPVDDAEDIKIVGSEYLKKLTWEQPE